MNTTVESLQALYVKLGGSIEDVADKTTIPEMLDAITLISGTDKPEIDGISINGGTVVTPDEDGVINLTIGDGSLDTLINAVPTDTANGTIATFADGADDIPVKNLTVDIKSVQSGTGDPSPDNIRPISGWTGVNVVCVERNIWDEEWELGSYSTTNGEATTYTDRIRSKNRISVVPNTEYFFKTSNDLTTGNIYFYDANDAFILARSSRGNAVTTTPDNCRYMRISMGLPYGATYNNDVSINYPSSDHDYHPYVGTSVNIDWTDEAGTVYGGSLDVSTGVLTVTHGVKSFNGGFDKHGSLPNGYYINYGFSDCGEGALLCNMLLHANKSFNNLSNGQFNIDTNYTRLCFKSSAFSNATEANAFFAENPLIVAYPLATPIVYQLTPQEVKTILGENNIFADTGDVSVEYRADIKKYIDKVVATAISALS